MRDRDPVDNGTYKDNMKRLIESVDKLTDELRKLTESVHNLVNAVGTPEPEFTEEYITLLKEDYDDEEIIKDIARSHDAHLRGPIDGERQC